MLPTREFAHQIAAAVQAGEATAESIVTEALRRARLVQNEHNAFITIIDAAVEKAKAIDTKRAAGESLGKLAGVPIVIKDNICTKGILTTAASKILSNFVPPYSATVVERLEQEDAIVIAKANLDEFGMGSGNENSAFGPASNAWNTDHVAGGSSGGSAVAVATGVAPIALGTDTGGSVRQPAAYNGIIGFKPTYGRLSRFGVIAYASSLDQVGVMARSSEDIALAMDVMAGHDPQDSTSVIDDKPAFNAALTDSSLKGMKIGFIEELCGEGNSEGTIAAIEKTKAQLIELGAKVVSVSLPNIKYAISSYYLIAPAEASSNLARYDGMIYGSRQGEDSLGQAESMMLTRGEGFGPEVKRRILTGSYALSAGYYDAYYGKALKVRRLIADDFSKAFESVDIMLTPTAPSPAFKIGEKTNDPLASYLIDIDTVAANLVGIGGMSIPAGKAEDNLPCGIQILAPVMKDERLVQVAQALQNAAGDDFSPLAKTW